MRVGLYCTSRSKEVSTAPSEPPPASGCVGEAGARKNEVPIARPLRLLGAAGPTGDWVRSLATSGTIDSITYWMSSAEVAWPSEERTEPMAQSSGMPMATSTYDGSTLPDVHAEPADTPMPFRSRPSTMDSDSTLRKHMLHVPGRRWVGCPFKRTSPTPSRTPC